MFQYRVSEEYYFILLIAQKFTLNGEDITVHEMSGFPSSWRVFAVFELDYMKVVLDPKSSTSNQKKSFLDQKKGYLNFKPVGTILIKEEDRSEEFASKVGF